MQTQGQLPIGWAVVIILLCSVSLLAALAYLLRYKVLPLLNKVRTCRFISRDQVKELPDLSLKEARTLGLLSGEEECPICGDFLGPEDSLKALGCRHVYHSECIEGWSVRYQVCPGCQRARLEEAQEMISLD